MWTSIHQISAVYAWRVFQTYNICTKEPFAICTWLTNVPWLEPLSAMYQFFSPFSNSLQLIWAWLRDIKTYGRRLLQVEARLKKNALRITSTFRFLTRKSISTLHTISFGKRKVALFSSSKYVHIVTFRAANVDLRLIKTDSFGNWRFFDFA